MDGKKKGREGHGWREKGKGKARQRIQRKVEGRVMVSVVVGGCMTV